MFSGWADKDIRHMDEARIIEALVMVVLTAFMVYGFFFML